MANSYIIVLRMFISVNTGGVREWCVSLKKLLKVLSAFGRAEHNMHVEVKDNRTLVPASSFHISVGSGP